MKVLIVGCGAVGQVFGHFLQEAGVELGFYARSESARRLEQALEQGGLQLFQVGHSHRQEPIPQRLDHYEVVRDIAGSRRFNPDQTWFTTPSTVYYSPWFQEFLQEVPSPRVICFPPEGGRPEMLPQNIDEGRLVFGGITFIAWQGDPDGGGERSGAVNYWLPPFVEIPLVGEGEGPAEVALLIEQAGLRAGVKKQPFQQMQAAVTALMSTFVIGYQLAGWSFGAFRRSPWLKLAAHGARDGVHSQLHAADIFTRRLFRVLASPVVFSVATRILPYLTPFDIEKYLRFHYNKTREQTLHLLDTFSRDGEKQGLHVGNLRLLRQGLVDSR